jgi:curved DNA-binding protein CbpA
MAEPFDPYAILQVSQEASQDVLQAAYRALARRLHPDHSDDPAASARMAQLNAAWETLGDPDKRAAYDRTHLSGVILDTTSRTAAATRPATPAAAAQPAAVPPAAPTSRPARPAPGNGVVWRRGPNGEGGAGPPPGNPSGSVLDFGRHIGWSMGEIARFDAGYLEWLDKQPQGAPYHDEIDRALRARGLRMDREPATRGTARGGARAPRRFGLSGR